MLLPAGGYGISHPNISIRVFIDFYAVIALLLMFLLKDINSKKLLKYLLYPLIILLILLNLFQAYQQRIWVFPLEYVTKDIYWDSFGRTVPVARATIDEKHIAKTVNQYSMILKRIWDGTMKIH